MATITGFPASNTISPSVRIIERDFSFLPTPVVFNNAGIVGFCSKGPINIPTFLTNITQLHTTFGFPHPADSNPYLIYAGEQYLSTGSNLWVVRVAETSPVDNEAAQTAQIPIPAAGGLVNFVSNVAGPYSYTENVFFRWRLNGVLAAKILVVLADNARPAPNNGLSYDATSLAAALNAQLVPGDGIAFFATTSGAIGLQSTFAYGPLASVELVSVANAFYGPQLSVNVLGQLVSADSISGLGFNMLPATTTGTNDRFPNNSYQTAGVYDFTGLVGINLQVVIDGTGNSTIDNVIQTIQLTSSVSTALEIVDEINSYISANLPGGFFAHLIGNNISLTTYQSGHDSQLLVKSSSSGAVLFGFSTVTAIGVSPQGVATDPTTYADAIVIGSNNSSGEVTFTITADSPGIEGNNTQIVIANNIYEGVFTISVFSNGNPVEAWGNVTKDESSVYYIESYLALVSNYILAVDNTATQALPMPGTYSLSGGTDGIPTDPDDQDALIIGNQSTMTGMESLSQPEQVNIDLLACPGFSSTAVIDAMINLCQNERQDCMAVIDPPFGLDVTDIVLWQNGRHPLNNEQFNSSYAALYWPWVMTHDNTNNIDVWVPPSGTILAVFAYSDGLAAPWYAAAGQTRGVCPNVLDIYTSATLTQRDLMYGNSNAINPIVSFTGVTGFLVWGNKTLQRASSLLTRVNVRRGCLAIEKEIRAAARPLLFEPNDATLQQQFINIASNILKGVQTSRGIFDWFVVCNSTLNTPASIDRNELRAQIGVQPIPAAEFIFIEFGIYLTGAFTENADQLVT